MGNRKQPFGYQMQFGTVVVQPQEARLVQYIFQQYILGASFRELVSALRNQAVSYDSGKLWNKKIWWPASWKMNDTPARRAIRL